MFVQHLRRREVEILLRHMHPPFPQCIHACLCTDTFQLRAAAAVHLLGDFQEVDPPREVHGAAVNAEYVGACFDSGGGVSG